MKVTLAQLNPVIGDIEGNLQKAYKAIQKAAGDKSDLVIFPELFLTGYPPRDLLEKPWFLKKTYEELRNLKIFSKKYPDIGILIGVPVQTGKKTGRGLYNSAVLLNNGEIFLEQQKSLLPVYDVFDEVRYFDPASEINTISFKGEILGIAVCEDSWSDPELCPGQNYSYNPMDVLAKKGATLFINISASPFHCGKEEIRYRIVKNHARKYKVPFVFVNQVGGNDELIFDGKSFCLDRKGRIIDALPSFRECIKTIDILGQGGKQEYKFQDDIETIYEALVLGIKDYVEKCGFSKVVLGLSGGIDSAVTCCLASEALGKENVYGIGMPGPFSSEGSLKDSKELAGNLNVEFKVISITDIYSSYLKTLNKHFLEKKEDITEENIQARIRGNILMAFSNKFGCLVLSTGNKSELALGYCTLYGDMSGGLCVLSDVPKTMVYRLAEYINRKNKVIPDEIIKKPPSAELRPGQKDQDTLPPYDILDAILELYIDKHHSTSEIVKTGFDSETVKWVVKEINRNEYKRRQAAPGLKVTTKAFGMGRRMPVAAKY